MQELLHQQTLNSPPPSYYVVKNCTRRLPEKKRKTENKTYTCNTTLNITTHGANEKQDVSVKYHVPMRDIWDHRVKFPRWLMFTGQRISILNMKTVPYIGKNKTISRSRFADWRTDKQADLIQHVPLSIRGRKKCYGNLHFEILYETNRTCS